MIGLQHNFVFAAIIMVHKSIQNIYSLQIHKQNKSSLLQNQIESLGYLELASEYLELASETSYFNLVSGIISLEASLNQLHIKYYTYRSITHKHKHSLDELLYLFLIILLPYYTILLTSRKYWFSIEYRIYQTMAIVYRSKRELKLADPKSTSLGPGTYDIDYQLVTKKIQTSKIYPPQQNNTKKNEKQNADPKPICINDQKENIFLIDEDQGLYVTQTRKKGILERSKTKRRQIINQSISPGPGSYQIQKNIIKPSKKYDGPKLQKSHVLEEIFKSPFYQTTISVPDFIQQMPAEDQIHRKLPIAYFSSIKKPGYTISKDQRFKENQNALNQNPGPGSYQLCSAEKPVPAKININGYVQLLDKHLSRITHDTSKYSEQSDDSIQYIKQALPGPGSYNLSNLSKTKSSFGKSIQNFGSSAQRFVEQKVYWKGKPMDKYVKPLKKYNRKDVAFGTSQSLGLLKKINHDVQMGPGYYNDPRTTVNKINQKLYKGYQGNFGSNAVRFRPKKVQYEGRTDFYISPYKQQPQFDDSQFGTAAFKSRTMQGQSYFTKKDYITDNYYCQDHNSIKQKIQDQAIKTTQQVVLQPPFGSGVVRFKYEVKEYESDQEFEDDIQPRYIPAFSKQSQNGRTFSKAKLQNKVNVDPGPGTYNHEDKWNSKSHNVLFLT